MYMDEHKQYSSIEAYEVAELAKEKGLTLLEGNYNESSSDSNNDSDCKGYCVTKMIAGQYFTLTDDSYIYQDHFYNGPTSCRTVWFRLTLEEAKKRIENFNGTFKNYPRFFAYIRVYKGEPEYYGFLQRLCLTEFAEKHGITYAEKFVCVGGQQSEVWHPCDSTGIDDVIDCCRKSFAKMDEDSYLVVSDLTRLNDEWDIWRNSYNIIAVVRQDVQDFLRQKELLSQVYSKSSNSKAYHFKPYRSCDGHQLKVVDQKLFDKAAKHGFPPSFFRETYFDQVTLYCLPKHADLYGSIFQNCAFAVCRINAASFIGASLYSSEFHSCVLEHADFFNSSIVHTHFHDSALSHVTFQNARLKSCNTIDCTLDGINYLNATLDGCSFGRVTASGIRNLAAAAITRGGATAAECRQNRAAILQTLGVELEAV